MGNTRPRTASWAAAEKGEPTLRTITIQADKPLNAIMEQ